MENKVKIEKPGIIEMIGLIIIILIFLFFPYMMIDQHLKDVEADRYYTPYKTN